MKTQKILGKSIALLFVLVLTLSFVLAITETGTDEGTISVTPGGGAEVVNHTGVCGDGYIDYGEQCDGLNLGGYTCETIPTYDFIGGALSCNNQCNLDMTGCILNESGTSSSSSSSSGGGGGGSSSSSSGGKTIILSGNSSNSNCIESWHCTEWSDCVEGETQTRECTDNNKCGTEKTKPIIERDCVQEPLISNNKPSTFAGITGAVIGTVGEHKGATILTILIFIGAATLFITTNKKKSLPSSSIGQ